MYFFLSPVSAYDSEGGEEEEYEEIESTVNSENEEINISGKYVIF